MRVLNPDFVPVESVEQAQLTSQEADLRAWFSANTDAESVSFGQIRTKYGKTEEQWPDGLIHQKLMDWGLEVVAG